MVNLIPPERKKSIVLEYWMRVLTIWSIILTVAIVFFAATLWPVYELVEGRIAVYAESADEANQKIASYDQVSQDLTQAMQQAQLIKSSVNERTLHSYVELFDRLETDGIEYSAVTISQISSGVLAPVNITGNARDRQALSDFKDRLVREEVIETVDLPINNLAKNSDIDFSMTVNMSNETDL